MCKVYIGYCGTSEIEHGLCACTVDNPLAKARGLSLRTGAQTMLYLPLNALENVHILCFFRPFYKGNTFCDLTFAYLKEKALFNWVLLVKQRIQFSFRELKRRISLQRCLY